MTYQECEELYKHGTKSIFFGGEYCKKLANNTYLFKDDEIFRIRFHATDIVRIYNDGLYLIDNGGWFTPTTKNRINSYAPINIYTRKGHWFYEKEGQEEEFKGECMIGR